MQSRPQLQVLARSFGAEKGDSQGSLSLLSCRTLSRWKCVRICPRFQKERGTTCGACFWGSAVSKAHSRDCASLKICNQGWSAVWPDDCKSR